MATTVDNLDNLSNDELRLRLLEYGFGNMPVTMTTRKVLIKKLRNAVDTSKSKTRRETVNVAKYSSEESGSDNEVKKPTKAVPNRRATIAAAPAPASVKESRTIAKPIRRSGRTTPLVLSSQPVLELANHSDEELAAVPASQPVQTNLRNKSRSPSLGKSGVVTTSYKQVFATPVVEEPEEDSIEDELIDLVGDDDDESSYSEQLDTAVPVPINGKATSAYSSLRTTKTTTTSTSSGSRNLGLEGVNLNPSVNLRRLVDSGPSGNFRSSSPKVSSLFGNYDAATAPTLTNTSYKRRYTTNTAAISSTTSPHYTNGNNDDEDLLKRHNTPFLSDFTRRLADLKADPLPATGVARGGSPSSSALSYRTSTGGDYYRNYDSKARSSIARQRKADTSVAGAFVSFLRACERKIRLPLLILLVLLCIVFVYVMLYQ